MKQNIDQIFKGFGPSVIRWLVGQLFPKSPYFKKHVTNKTLSASVFSLLVWSWYSLHSLLQYYLLSKFFKILYFFSFKTLAFTYTLPNLSYWDSLHLVVLLRKPSTLPNNLLSGGRSREGGRKVIKLWKFGAAQVVLWNCKLTGQTRDKYHRQLRKDLLHM